MTPKFHGEEWLRSRNLTRTQLARVIAAVEMCCEQHPTMVSTVGVRPVGYTGEPQPIAVVVYGPNQSKFYKVVWG